MSGGLLEKPIAFVVPWYGADIAGGAEALCRGFCMQLRAAGEEVEALTTCARDFSGSWEKNHHRPGVTEEEGVLVRRFPLRRRNRRRFDAVNLKALSQIPTSPEEETAFYAESIRSRKLERYIEKHRERYHFIALPYCFGSSYYAVKAARGNALLLPCLHEESYARMRPTREMLSQARGLIFNSRPEQKLARRLHDLNGVPQIVLGMGVEFTEPGDPATFRRQSGRQRPFLLYVGRRDATKNVPLLVGYFQRLLEDAAPEIDLLLAGAGPLEIPSALSDRIVDLGVISDTEKRNALAAATALVQPSTNESFAIVLFEAWREGVPVLVNEDCAVTVETCRETNGGLWFKDYYEFREAVEWLLNQPEQARRLGQQGRRRTRENYSWDKIIDKLRRFVREHG